MPSLSPLKSIGLQMFTPGTTSFPSSAANSRWPRRRVAPSLHRPAQVLDLREQLAVAALERRVLAQNAGGFHGDHRGLRRLLHPESAVVPDPEEEESRPGAGHGHEAGSGPSRESRLQKIPAEEGHAQPREPLHLHRNHEEDQELHVGEEERVGEEHRRARHDAARGERVSRDERRERGPERRRRARRP